VASSSKTKSRSNSRTRREKEATRRAAAARKVRLQWVGVIGVGVAILGGVLFLSLQGQESQTGESAAESFDLPAIEGDGRVALADFEGKPVVVNFFASWCTACDAELPYFADISEQVSDEVTFIGVNSLENGNRLDMPERHGITWWPLARDIGGNNGSGLHDDLGIRPGSMPGTAFYDAEGTLLTVVPGSISEADLRSNLQQFYGVDASA
jgi:thiol-disulfide isomerase/thioredoxin